MKKGQQQSESDFRLSEQIEIQSFLHSRSMKKQFRANKGKKIPDTNNGSWNLDEEIKFMVFMQTNRNIFQDKPQRKKCHIFKQMSNFLTTRTAQQCRSHHQKYQVSLGEFDKIIEHIRLKIERVNNKKIKERESFQKLKQIREIEACSMGMNFDWYSPNRIPENCLAFAVQQVCKNSKQITCSNNSLEVNCLQEGQGFKIIEKERTPTLSLQLLINFDDFFAS